MNHAVGHIQEERVVSILLNELDRFFGVLSRQLFLIFWADLRVDGCIALYQRQVRPFSEAF